MVCWDCIEEATLAVGAIAGTAVLGTVGEAATGGLDTPGTIAAAIGAVTALAAYAECLVAHCPSLAPAVQQKIDALNQEINYLKSLVS
jgi:hypothetical protein